MADYQLESKQAFSVTGYGTQLTSAYTDYAGLAAEKAAFWQAVNADGRLAKLQAAASDQAVYIVNEAIDNKMMYYVAVSTTKTIADADRTIQFPTGEYVIVPGAGDDLFAVAETVTGAAFGAVLGTLTDLAYVGGPNAAKVHPTDAGFAGEMLIPVVRH